MLILLLLSSLSCKNALSDQDKQQYLAKGNEISQTTFKELSSKLTEQMELGGPAQAIPFCNVEALPITNQLSEKFDVTIRRTSDKLRNLNNKPTERELEIIANYKNSISTTVELSPVVEIDNKNKKHFYAPIFTNAKCLVCHGKLVEKVNVKTDSIIKFLYPDDLAIGYVEGELRGIWSIEFN